MTGICGTVMIFCGPFPTLEKFWFSLLQFQFRFRFQIQTIFCSFSNKQIFKSCLSMLEAALFPRKLAPHFGFFDFCIPFYVRSGSKSSSGTSSPAKAYSCGSWGSGFIFTIGTDVKRPQNILRVNWTDLMRLTLGCVPFCCAWVQICTKSCLSMFEAALFPRKLAAKFWFFDLCIPFFMFDPDQTPVPEPGIPVRFR